MCNTNAHLVGNSFPPPPRRHPVRKSEAKQKQVVLLVVCVSGQVNRQQGRHPDPSAQCTHSWTRCVYTVQLLGASHAPFKRSQAAKLCLHSYNNILTVKTKGDGSSYPSYFVIYYSTDLNCFVLTKVKVECNLRQWWMTLVITNVKAMHHA